VRGDAVAGLLVVFLNIIGGLIIGVPSRTFVRRSPPRAIPCSPSATGCQTDSGADRLHPARPLVSKAGVSGAAQGARKQLYGSPRRGHAAGHAGAGDAAGIPMLPFLVLAARRPPCPISARKNKRVTGGRPEPGAAAPQRQRHERHAAEADASELKIDDSRSNAVMRCCRWSTAGWYRPADRAEKGAAGLACGRNGIVMPARPHPLQRAAGRHTYVIKIRKDAGNGRDWSEQSWLMDPAGTSGVPGSTTTEPTSGYGDLGRCRAEGKAALKG